MDVVDILHNLNFAQSTNRYCSLSTKVGLFTDCANFLAQSSDIS